MSQVAGALSSRGMEIGGALARERARGINTRFLHAGVREPGCLLVADPSKPVFKRWDFRVPVCVNSTRTGEGDARGRGRRKWAKVQRVDVLHDWESFGGPRGRFARLGDVFCLPIV